MSLSRANAKSGSAVGPFASQEISNCELWPGSKNTARPRAAASRKKRTAESTTNGKILAINLTKYVYEKR